MTNPPQRPSYAPTRVARESFLKLRGLKHRVLGFGPKGATPAIFLHGWADTAATFQFLIDAFQRDHAILALDWRGFGGSDWQRGPYWFPDYLADLDALLDRAVPDGPVTLVGHSMGGNIAGLYGGIRPERVRAVVNLEGLGLKRTEPGEAPGRYRRWLDELKETLEFGRFESVEQFAHMLVRKNPRLTPERATFVAMSWARELDRGGVAVGADPAHKLVNPVLYRREEAEACWRQCVAPVLMVFGAESKFRASLGADGSDEYFRSIFSNLTLATLKDAGHMLHHEQPEALAALIEPWLTNPPATVPAS